MSIFQKYGSPGFRFEEALRKSEIPQSLLSELEGPMRVLELRISFERDNGSREYLDSIRICYNNRRGPSKGGVRFVPVIKREDLLSLSFLMMVKCAVNDLPHGGAAGAVAIDPTKYSNTELERVARAYVRAYFQWIGPETDILSPDQNTNAALMAVMQDECDKLAGKPLLGAINGKPPNQNGSQGRHGATALGAACVLEEFYQLKREKIAGKRVAIQGFGNAGGTLALELHNRGAQIVAICDSKAALFQKSGLDIPKLVAACDASRKTNVHTIPKSSISGAQSISPSEILAIDCDVLVPSAISKQLTAENASAVKASVVLEIANGCTDYAAEKNLHGRGISLLPDVLANAGGVTVSHFEWVQNRAGESWTKEEVHKKLETRMRSLSKELFSVSALTNQPLSIAAHIMGIRRYL